MPADSILLVDALRFIIALKQVLKNCFFALSWFEEAILRFLLAIRYVEIVLIASALHQFMKFGYISAAGPVLLHELKLTYLLILNNANIIMRVVPKSGRDCKSISCTKCEVRVTKDVVVLRFLNRVAILLFKFQPRGNCIDQYYKKKNDRTKSTCACLIPLVSIGQLKVEFFAYEIQVDKEARASPFPLVLHD